MRYLTILFLLISTLSFSQEIYIPNAFTPDGDGLNDYFGVFCTEKDSIDYFRMEIYNSNGELVFQTLDINGKWQGGVEYFGNTKPFVYYIEYKCSTKPIVERKKGFIIILR
jgi:gliding motility-associated-like protein